MRAGQGQWKWSANKVLILMLCLGMRNNYIEHRSDFQISRGKSANRTISRPPNVRLSESRYLGLNYLTLDAICCTRSSRSQASDVDTSVHSCTLQNHGTESQDTAYDLRGVVSRCQVLLATF